MKYLTRISVTICSTFALFSPLVALALTCDNNNGTSLCPPTGNSTLMQYVELALRGFVLIALPILAFFIVYAGFKFILARGNPEQLMLAKWNFLFVIVGTVLILGAWTFASLIGASFASISN